MSQYVKIIWMYAFYTMSSFFFYFCYGFIFIQLYFPDIQGSRPISKDIQILVTCHKMYSKVHELHIRNNFAWPSTVFCYCKYAKLDCVFVVFLLGIHHGHLILNCLNNTMYTWYVRVFWKRFNKYLFFLLNIEDLYRSRRNALIFFYYLSKW